VALNKIGSEYGSRKNNCWTFFVVKNIKRHKLLIMQNTLYRISFSYYNILFLTFCFISNFFFFFKKQFYIHKNVEGRCVPLRSLINRIKGYAIIWRKMKSSWVLLRPPPIQPLYIKVSNIIDSYSYWSLFTHWYSMT